MSKKSGKGNPWHDAKGRFCHGPEARVDTWGNEISDEQRQEAVCRSEKTVEEYKERAERKELQEKNKEVASELLSKEKITKEEAQQYLEGLKKDKEYQQKLNECDKASEEYNKVAQPLLNKLNDYDRAIDEGRIPNQDFEEIRKESEEARRLYEKYKEKDREAMKYEKDLRQINNKLAESEGKNPAFYSGVIPRKSMVMVTMPYEGPHAQKGFKDEVTDESSKEFQMTLSEASALRGENKEETLKRFRELTKGKDKTPDNYEKAFKQLYKEKQGNIVALDIETNSLSPAQGNIIEFGCVDNNGKEFNRLYSPTKEQMKANGVGLTEIHNISKDMVKGHKTFESDTDNILSKMKGKTILVHNKGFELNWFRQQIPGFAEAEVNGDIKVVDTMHICQKFCDTKRNRLQDFVEYTGGKYENAHRSSADAKMTINALNRWINS